MSLIRPAELGPRTARHLIARRWPDLREVAVQHMPLSGPPSWAVYRRDPSGWVRISPMLSAGDWLAWPADDLRCESVDVIPAAVARLLDTAEEI